MKYAVTFALYWVYIFFVENIDTNTRMMRTDDYRGRYRDRDCWWDLRRSHFTRAS